MVQLRGKVFVQKGKIRANALDPSLPSIDKTVPMSTKRVLLSVSGWLYDITGTYDLSFYLAGFFIALSGVLLLAMPLISLYRKCLNGSRKEEADKDFANMNRVWTSIKDDWCTGRGNSSIIDQQRCASLYLSIQRNLWKHNTSKQKELQLAPVQLVLHSGNLLIPA